MLRGLSVILIFGRHASASGNTRPRTSLLTHPPRARRLGACLANSSGKSLRSSTHNAPGNRGVRDPSGADPTRVPTRLRLRHGNEFGFDPIVTGLEASSIRPDRSAVESQ